MATHFPHRLEIVDNSLEITVLVMGIQIHNRLNFIARKFVKHSMLAILRELELQPTDGYLAHEYLTKGSTSLLVQYWTNYEKLIEYARNKNLEHFPAWVTFNSKISAMDSIGIWHEIYQLQPGSYKAVYKNCSPSGMGKFLLKEQYKRYKISQ